MIATVETILLLCISLLGILVYRALIHSQWFNRFIGSIVETPTEGRDTLDRLDRDQEAVLLAAEEAAVKEAEQARLKHDLECASRESPEVRKARKSRSKKIPKEIQKESADS